MMQRQLRDSYTHYGTISRALHWGMAVVLAWQFTSVLARVLFSDSTFDDFMWSTHRSSGVLLMLLILLRASWALLNVGRRPPAVSVMATLGHVALYALMFIVPLVALLRQYGSGRELSAFGITLMPGFEGERIDWMVSAGSNFHGLLGWTMLALIAGHVSMVAVHRRLGHGDIMERMARGR